MSAALIGALAPFGASLINTIGSIGANNQNRETQVQLLDRANEFAVQQEQNARSYNSPLNQKNLMIQAGMNPNLANPSVSFSPGSAVGAQSVPNVMTEPKFSLQSPDMQALTLDIAKENMRADLENKKQDVERKKLDNEDRRLEVNAHKRGYKDGDIWNSYPDDLSGTDIEVNVPDELNYYENIGYKNAQDARGSRFDADRRQWDSKTARKNYDALIEDYPFLRKMTKKQYQQLCHAVVTADLNNQLLSEQVKLAKEFGIMPNEQGNWFTFLKMFMREPEFLKRVGSTLSEWYDNRGEHRSSW